MKYLKEFIHLNKEEINPVDLISSQKLNMQHSKKEINFLEKILLLDYKCEIFTNKFWTLEWRTLDNQQMQNRIQFKFALKIYYTKSAARKSLSAHNTFKITPINET